MKSNWNMIRIIAVFLFAAILLPVLVSCGGDETTSSEESTTTTKKEDPTDPNEGEQNMTKFDKVKVQWREMLVGSSDQTETHSAAYNARVKSISDDCKSTWDKYKSTRDKKWGYAINYKAGDESKISAIYSNILILAKGYATVGSEYYHDQALLASIKEALEYGYKALYGQTVANTSKEDMYGNWWYWDIGIPRTLVDILMLMEEELTDTQIDQYLKAFDARNLYPSMTAANKVWISYSCIGSSILQNDARRANISISNMKDVFYYVIVSGDGFYTDGSFIQHEKHPYTGGYGLSMMITLSSIMMVLHDTEFEITSSNLKNQYAWILESLAPLNYGGNFFASVRGREVDRNTSEYEANNSFVATMIKMTTYAPDEVKEALLPMIRYHMLARDTDYADEVPLGLTDFAVALKADESVVPMGYDGVKVFGMMDRIVQHTPEYGVCVALNSTRIYKYECINNENMDGWYHSDGMIYIYTDGYDYNYDFFNYVNPYRIPGTTVTTAERDAVSIKTNEALLGDSDFVGGVDAGKYGMAVFQLGYKANKHYTSGIHANKTYFMFDNEIVAVGSGVRDTASSEVITVIENRIWREGDVFTVNGTQKELASDTVESGNAKYMHFTNMGGYVFFEDTDVNFNHASAGDGFLEIWTSHGSRPTNGTYAYIYLPEATAEETAAYNAFPDVEILTQTDSIHVVRENKTNVTGYAFYRAGSANGVTVSERCALMVGEENGTYTVNISDPTHLIGETALQITLDISAAEVVASCEEATVSFEGGKVIITLDLSSVTNMGQTFTVSIK